MNCLLLAAASMLALSPSKSGNFTYVENPTRDKVASLAAAGKLPLVEDHSLTDELVAYTNWAEHASAVAFDRMPRPHLRHTWKDLGVTLLKTVAYDPEMSADHFRRELGFMAFQSGADGVWLPITKGMPPGFMQAFKEAKEDWRVLNTLRELSEKASKHPDSAVWIESRRVTYWFGHMPASWENLDVLRLECVAYIKRLEQLLKLPAGDFPVKKSEPIAQQLASDALPYADLPEKPHQTKLPKLGDTANLGGGLSFSANANGFTITYSHTNGPSLKQWSNPGGSVDFRVYVLGKDGKYLPYRFHCDLDPQWYTARAPARCRGSFLFGTDERFRPFSIAYGVGSTRVYTWPRLRDFGPDYPDPRPSFSLAGNKEGGWRASVSVSWMSLYGQWPMQRVNKQDVWYVGVDRAPWLKAPIAARVLWPKGHKDHFRTFCQAITTGGITGIYKTELDRTFETWFTSFRERFYPFAKTEKPTFHRYDLESDTMFLQRLVQPLVDENANAWDLIITDKEHKKPKFAAASDAVKMTIWKKLDRMFYLSHNVGKLRADYLVDRYAGKEPPEYVKKPDNSKQKLPDEPDADYNADDIQLDDKEF